MSFTVSLQSDLEHSPGLVVDGSLRFFRAVEGYLLLERHLYFDLRPLFETPNYVDWHNKKDLQERFSYYKNKATLDVFWADLAHRKALLPNLALFKETLFEWIYLLKHDTALRTTTDQVLQTCLTPPYNRLAR